MIKALIEEFAEHPQFAYQLREGIMYQEFYMKAEDEITEQAWVKLQHDAYAEMENHIANKKISCRALPEVKATFKCLQDNSESDQVMFGWGYVYFHGILNDKFDERDMSPGDLVKCSIDLYKFPLGMQRVQVDGDDAVAYIYEEDKAGMYDDGNDNLYPRKLRHGLIVAWDDDVERHLHAKKKLDERSSYL